MIERSIKRICSAELKTIGVPPEKLIDINTQSFPFTDNIHHCRIMGISGDTIAHALSQSANRMRLTLDKMIAVHYTLLEVELAKRFFANDIKDQNSVIYRNTSYKAPYLCPPVADALGLKEDSHFHKYQVPSQFRKYMRSALVSIYEEESKHMKRKSFYFWNRNKSTQEIYTESARGAYGIYMKKGSEKAKSNYEKDEKDNLIINRYWLRDNGKIKKK